MYRVTGAYCTAILQPFLHLLPLAVDPAEELVVIVVPVQLPTYILMEVAPKLHQRCVLIGEAAHTRNQLGLRRRYLWVRVYRCGGIGRPELRLLLLCFQCIAGELLTPCYDSPNNNFTGGCGP